MYFISKIKNYGDDMDKKLLLERTFSIDDIPKGFDHTFNEVNLKTSQNLKKDWPICSIEYKTKESQKGGSEIVTNHSYSVKYEDDIYGCVEVKQKLIEQGMKINKLPKPLFIYYVEENFPNLIENTIRNLVKNENNLYFKSKIPEKKLNNAIKKYASSVDPTRVIFLYDDTVFGSATDGFLITDSALYYHYIGTKYEIRFNNIVSWNHFTEEVVSGKNTKTIDSISILYENEDISIPHDTSMIHWNNFDNLLEIIHNLKKEGMTNDVDGFVIIQDMSNSVRISYLSAIIWMTYNDDKEIDGKELGELQMLMTQLQFPPELRLEARRAISEPENLDITEIIKKMFSEVPKGSELAVSISLIKDMMRVYQSAHDTSPTKSLLILNVAERLKLDTAKLSLIEEALNFDRKVLAGDIEPGEVMKMASALSAKGAAIGVPIAAIYLSGSVVGLSAAGVTSGLSALGLGGVLGLSSMVTGIGVAIILGVGIYKGVQWIMGGSQVKQKQQFRELMLQEVLRNHQKTISNLGEDMAYFSQKIVSLTKDITENKLKIEKLGKEITLFANAMKGLVARENKYETELKIEVEKRTAK